MLVKVLVGLVHGKEPWFRGVLKLSTIVQQYVDKIQFSLEEGRKTQWNKLHISTQKGHLFDKLITINMDTILI